MSNTIKEEYDGLRPDDKRKLAYAFDHGIAQVVELEGGRVIGVNLKHVKNVKITQQSGDWALGEKTNV